MFSAAGRTNPIAASTSSAPIILIRPGEKSLAYAMFGEATSFSLD
jgi:hypothetical protein